MTTALEGGERSAPRPGRFIPGKDPVPIVQEVGWAPGLVWTGAENLAPLGFDPRTVQPVASRYTDYSLPFTELLVSMHCLNEVLYKISWVTAKQYAEEM